MVTSVSYLTKEEANKPQLRKGVVVDRELERIYKKHKGIHPDLILQEATDEKHPLHEFFEWDNSKAALKYRLQQARDMYTASKFIATLVENGKSEKITVRKYVSVHRGEKLIMRDAVLKKEDTRKPFIASKIEALRAWCNSIADVEELRELRETILANIPSV